MAVYPYTHPGNRWKRLSASLEVQITSKMPGAEGNGKPPHYFPKRITMMMQLHGERLSCNPANTRRHLTGQGGVKHATGHAAVSTQALHGKYATGARKISVRNPHRIGTWNVRGLLQDGKLIVVEREMERKNINILGVSETHWKQAGHFVSPSGNKIYFSGPESESSKGVAFIVPPKLDKFVMGYKPINERIILIKLSTAPCYLNIIQVYAPTAQSTEEELEHFFSSLSQTVKEIPKREIVIIMGDLNAKVGSTSDDAHVMRCVGKYGIGERNERGERLLQFCNEENLTLMNTCFSHHIRRLYTWISPGGRYRNQIDYIMVQSRWKSSVLNTVTYPGADCGSDHQLLMAVVKIKLKNLKKSKPPKPFSNVNLADYRKEIEQKLKSVQIDQDQDSNNMWKTLKETIVKTASKNLMPQRVLKNFITDETALFILERRELKERGLRTPEDKDHYEHLNREVQKRCRHDRDAFLNNICLELEQHSVKNETKDLFQKVKELSRTSNPKTYVIEDESGKILCELKLILERWRQYCADLYDTGESIKPPVRWTSEDQEPELLLDEIEHAVKALKIGKAPGRDCIPSELIKSLGPVGIKIIADICNSIWKTGQWPEEWTESTFIPIHKKGSTRKCDNYRTIALIPHVSKIMLHILNKRLKNYLDNQIPEEQAGFVKGKGTREQILNIRQIIEKSREFNSPVIMCFIDYSKAFDCVRWDKMWDVLCEMGVPKHLVGLISSLYMNNLSYVKIDTDCSAVFKTKKGVRQGCILSPMLFNIYGEYIMRKALENWEGGFVIGGKRVSNLRYADDTTLLATTFEDMKILLKRVEDESNAMGLSINMTKTKLMCVDRAGILDRVTNHITNVDVVEKFMYLGSLVTNDGSCVPEIKRRIVMAKDAMSRMVNIWKNRSINLRTKMRLVRALVFPIFLYGVETWTILARERQRIDAFEMWCWRRMMRIPWTAKRTNVSILAQLKIKTRLSTVCLRRIFTYFGHIARRDGNNLEKIIIVGNVEGKRGRGRSPTRWTDQLKGKDATSFQDVVRIATDRNRWRNFVRSRMIASCSDHDLQS